MNVTRRSLAKELANEIVAGVDEAGRGPLAGPVVVAAVILDATRPIRGLADSKVLSEADRERLAPRIRERAIAYAIIAVDIDEIERLNILGATLVGMTRALLALSTAPTFALIDGNRLPKSLPCTARAIIGGTRRKQRSVLPRFSRRPNAIASCANSTRSIRAMASPSTRAIRRPNTSPRSSALDRARSTAADLRRCGG